VAVNYRTPERETAETVAQILAAGGRALAVRADVSDADQVAVMIREVTRQLGPIDLLVNNAGVLVIARASAVDIPLFRKLRRLGAGSWVKPPAGHVWA
jgi:3-oxoacyl-[acyl-carrier protein] reductase